MYKKSIIHHFFALSEYAQINEKEKFLRMGIQFILLIPFSKITYYTISSFGVKQPTFSLQFY